MKKILSITLSALATGAVGQVSNSGLALNKGTTIESEIISYKTPLLQDALAWIKMKPGKKVKTVIQFNEDISNGKITPGGKTVAPTRISEMSQSGNASVYSGTTKIGVTDYGLTLRLSNDTLYYLLNDGLPFPIPGKNNDTTGIWCFGVRKYPKSIEVGSYLPGYINEMNLFPYDLKTNRKEFFNFNGNDGYSYSGFVTVRKTRSMTINSIMINTPYYVLAKEEIDIDGKKYLAYKLLNEQWSKSTTNSVVKEDPSDYFNNPYTSNKIKENIANRGKGWDTPEKKAEILESMQTQTGLVTNEQGYSVNVQESWYVPELGLIAKSRYFDGAGALQMESRIISIK